MKYLSEVTKKLYNTPEECQAAEKAWEEEQAKLRAEREAAAKERKERAAEVEAAYKKAEESERIAHIDRQEYLKLRNKFVNDFGSFHMTVHKQTPVPMHEIDELNNLLRFFFM